MASLFSAAHGVTPASCPKSYLQARDTSDYVRMTLRNFADAPGLPKEIGNTFKTGIEIDLNLSVSELTLTLLLSEIF